MNKYIGTTPTSVDFRVTNVIDWKDCFANTTVETYTFLSLMSYSLNIYLKYINKLLMTKILHGRLNAIETVSSNEKKQCLNMLRQENLYLTHPPI